jgi:hypothetical protein
MRTAFDPLIEADDLHRNRFLMAARSAAEMAGLVKPVAQCLAAALREMESNIHEHSGRATTGILAYQARPSLFEFVAAELRPCFAARTTRAQASAGYASLEN